MRFKALLAVPFVLACEHPLEPVTEPASVVFPTSVEWREDYPVQWTHILGSDGGCHVRAEMQEGWPLRYGTITIYPLVQVEGEWKQTGLSYMSPAKLNALDKLFSPKGHTFYEGAFDALVLVKATNKRGQTQLVQTIFTCRTP